MYTYRRIWMIVDKDHSIQGIFHEVCTISRGQVHIRVVIPDVDNSTMASLAHIAAPVIQHVFSLREY